MKTKIENLREHLFETMERLLDDEHPIELDKAKMVCEIGRVIIDSGRAEVEAQKLLVSSEVVVRETPAFFTQTQKQIVK